MDKFGRNYQLFVQTSIGTTVEIGLPFTIEFDITRTTLTSANVCQVRVYNLSKINRNLIRKNSTALNDYRAIELRAGYGVGLLPTIFTGNISQAWSVREGTTFVTQIECYDGGFAYVNGQTNLQFPAGVTQDTVIRTLASTLPNVTVGAIGPNFTTPLARGNSYAGNTMSLLGELTGGGAFIDKGKLNVLGTTEYIAGVGGTLLITPASGLLGTPVLEVSIAHFDMIFEPTMDVGCSASVAGFTEANFNGLYKITAVKHRGMISGAVCGTVVTTGEFFFDKALTPVASAA